MATKRVRGNYARREQRASRPQLLSQTREIYDARSAREKGAPANQTRNRSTLIWARRCFYLESSLRELAVAASIGCVSNPFP